MNENSKKICLLWDDSKQKLIVYLFVKESI